MKLRPSGAGTLACVLAAGARFGKGSRWRQDMGDLQLAATGRTGKLCSQACLAQLEGFQAGRTAPVEEGYFARLTQKALERVRRVADALVDQHEQRHLV